MSSFMDLTETKKGTIGEQIAYQMLEADGWTLYIPRKEASHPIDVIGVKDNNAYLIDIKTKPRRIKYEDTGIDVNDWQHYLELSKNVNVFLIFVDEYTGTIYGKSVKKLEEHKKYHIEGSIIYFEMSAFKHMKVLTGEELNEIKKYNNRAETYNRQYQNSNN